MSINRVNISGNLTRDPELRTTQGGTAVLGFGVAVNDRRRNPQTGEWEDVPNFIDCTVFGNRAGALANFLRKGQKVAIEGKLRWSQWEKDGQKRSKIEVIVDECEFLAPRQDGQQQGYQQAPQGYGQQPPAPQYQQPQAPQYQQPRAPQYAPQAPQGYQNPPAQGYGQNQAPQAPSAPAYQQPAQQPPAQAYQPTLPQQQPGQIADVYDEDIPF